MALTPTEFAKQQLLAYALQKNIPLTQQDALALVINAKNNVPAAITTLQTNYNTFLANQQAAQNPIQAITDPTQLMNTLSNKNTTTQITTTDTTQQQPVQNESSGNGWLWGLGLLAVGVTVFAFNGDSNKGKKKK